MSIGPAEYLKLEETTDWIEPREAELQGYADALITLIDETLQEAFEQSNDARAADTIVAAAQAIAEVYGCLLEWSSTSPARKPVASPPAISSTSTTRTSNVLGGRWPNTGGRRGVAAAVCWPSSL